MVEQPQALLAGAEGRRGRDRAEARLELGRELDQLGGHGPGARTQGLGALLVHPAPQRFDERQVGRGGLVLVAAALEHRGAVEAREHHHLVRQPGLARPGLARDQRDVAAALLGEAPQLAQLVELGDAPHQAPAHQLLEQRDPRGLWRRGERRRAVEREARQRLGGGARAGEALRRILGQQAQDDGFERRRQIGAEGARRRDRGVKVLGDHDQRVVAGERQPAGDQLVEHHAQRVEIGAAVDLAPQRLLGGEVGGGADDRALGGDARVSGDRDPEVGELGDRAIGTARQQDVLGLEVAMHHVVGVGVLQRLAQLAADRRDLGQRQRAGAAQAGARDQLHDDERRARLLTGVVDAHDVRMVERRGGARLVLEARPRLVVEAGERQHLDRHLAIELGVARAVDHAHRAATQHRLDLIAVLERRARRQRRAGHARAAVGARRKPSNRSVSRARPPFTVLNAR